VAILEYINDSDLKDTIIGIQLLDGTKVIGQFVKSNADYIWVRTAASKKPKDVPRVIISRLLVLLEGYLDDE
jgi:hypothetical protein